MKDEIKKATQLAENELQDKRIENFKTIIKSLLQKKLDKEKEKDELEEEIKLIKQDIDDFKAGRLDKIKERHEINPKAKEVAPINITIINDNTKVIYPTQPWRWNYEISWHNPHVYTTSALAYGNGTTNTVYLAGTTSANFASGTYELSNASALRSNIVSL